MENEISDICDTIEDKLSLSNNNTKIDLTELENNIIKMENGDNCDTIEIIQTFDESIRNGSATSQCEVPVGGSGPGGRTLPHRSYRIRKYKNLFR